VTTSSAHSLRTGREKDITTAMKRELKTTSAWSRSNDNTLTNTINKNKSIAQKVTRKKNTTAFLITIYTSINLYLTMVYAINETKMTVENCEIPPRGLNPVTRGNNMLLVIAIEAVINNPIRMY
jgi:hypothetical protein